MTPKISCVSEDEIPTTVNLKSTSNAALKSAIQWCETMKLKLQTCEYGLDFEAMKENKSLHENNTHRRILQFSDNISKLKQEKVCVELKLLKFNYYIYLIFENGA